MFNNITNRKKQSDGGCGVHDVTALPVRVALLHCAGDAAAGHPADIRRPVPVHNMRAVRPPPQDEHQEGIEGSWLKFSNFFVCIGLVALWL